MEQKKIKCLVWDLDNTLWEGTLLEGGATHLRPGARETIIELDKRGILHSIASKNEYADAVAALEKFGLSDYFLVPQIGWGDKSAAISKIATALNLGLDSFAFIDDLPYEREEVAFSHPEVRIYDAACLEGISKLSEFTPHFITADSARRRKMYAEDLGRKAYEEEFSGDGNAFSKSLNMKLTLSAVAPGDLERVEELTLRTNQLNSTGLTYSYEELVALMDSPRHIFLIAELVDKFGSYGKIGLLLCEKGEEALKVKLLLMSCRVMTRGIGTALLVHLIKLARAQNLALYADFVSTARNRIMYITYKLMGFEEAERDGDRVLLKYCGGDKEYPDYLDMHFA